VLLNLSNHPSATWEEAQATAARHQYGQVTDWPFPAIDPYWNEVAVAALADQYAERARQLRPRPTAIHIMGEMNFVFRFVYNMLGHAEGLPCVASTTRRRVRESEPGKKMVEFEFVQFRLYG
jgi:hypothetical protein